MRISLDELKSMLWGAAVLLRGKINATGYKEYIFPLVFFKRISDVHLEERRKALEMSGGDEEFADAKENYKFDIPKGCLWDDIRVAHSASASRPSAAIRRNRRAGGEGEGESQEVHRRCRQHHQRSDQWVKEN